jgi:hypothetical protein
VRVKFSHLTGYTSFAYARVVTRTVSQAEGSDKVYIVELECRNPKLMGGIGAGGTPVTAGTGNNQVPPVNRQAQRRRRSSWGPTATRPSRSPRAPRATYFDGTPIVPQLVDGDDATPGLTRSRSRAGGGPPGFQIDLLNAQTVASVRVYLATSSTHRDVEGARRRRRGLRHLHVYEDAGVWCSDRTPFAASYTLSSTAATHRYWRVGILVGNFTSWRPLELRDAAGLDLMRFLPATAPAFGQPSGEQTPTPAPDGATTTFTTPASFVASTLRVEVDGIDVTDDVTSSTATTFTLSWAPDASAKIRVWYKGDGTGT